MKKQLLYTPDSTVQVFTDVKEVVAVPGDLLLFSTKGPTGAVIRFVTRSWASHAAICVGVVSSEDRTPLISQEKMFKGDIIGPVTDVKASKIAVVHLMGDFAQREQAVRFAESVGHSKYGFAACLGDLLSAVTHTEFDFGIRGHMNCSAASTRALERFGYIPGKSPIAMSPGDLAKDFKAC